MHQRLAAVQGQQLRRLVLELALQCIAIDRDRPGLTLAAFRGLVFVMQLAAQRDDLGDQRAFGAPALLERGRGDLDFLDLGLYSSDPPRLRTPGDQVISHERGVFAAKHDDAAFPVL